ncbi:MAG: hydrogenase formation protein HypD [Candidatus Cloacimonetes bacterium]|nr:hydrogenase formation protein HypD [Candidatus Cloacimonadota bacterium]
MDSRSYRDPALMSALTTCLQDWEKPVSIMEVCGSHTMAIGRWGIRKLLPSSIRLLSGPGCPVCVTPMSMIDQLAGLKDVTIATFGDLIRVPGERISLEKARAQGLDVQIIYSPLEALKIARKRKTILAGIGFETTIPGIAQTVLEAERQGISDFYVYPAFKLIPPALKALLKINNSIDGFILPGHVSVIIGARAYRFLPRDFGRGGVITGFEPVDIMLAISRLLKQLKNGDCKIENEYSRVVNERGNNKAQDIIYKVFQPERALWRGLGWLENSGLGFKPAYERFDARLVFSLPPLEDYIKSGCRCPDVLRGVIIPSECPLFGSNCNPAHPLGSCMVSSEGSCAAYFKYERNSNEC